MSMNQILQLPFKSQWWALAAAAIGMLLGGGGGSGGHPLCACCQ